MPPGFFVFTAIFSLRINYSPAPNFQSDFFSPDSENHPQKGSKKFRAFQNDYFHKKKTSFSGRGTEECRRQ